MMMKGLATTLAVLALVALSAPWVLAQSGAKALFYGSSGAMLQSNAPVSGSTMQRIPDPPSSNLATGFPSSPAMPGTMPPAPAPTMPAMTPPPSATTPAMTQPSPPSGIDQTGATSPSDPTKLVDELKSALDALPPGPGGGPASTSAAAKDLTVVAPATGVRYWVDLVDAQGNQRQVTTDYVFRRGDRIKLHVMSNQDGYLTLVNVGTSGRTTVLFPSRPNDNFVKAGTDNVIPPGSYLRFDGNPGQEVLILTFSLGPDAAPSGPAAVALAQGAKDLVHEVDRSSAQPAAYAVVPGRPGGAAGTIALQIRLNHQ
jgi:hypothetical protein